MTSEDRPIKTITIPDQFFEGLDENDDWAVFTALKRWRDAKKASNLEFFQEHGKAILEAHPHISNVVQHTTWHYQFTYNKVGRCDYYPSTNKLVHPSSGKKTATVTGSLDQLLNRLRNLAGGKK